MSTARLHPFSANLDFLFGEHAFLDRFAVAADAGFGAVEFLFPYEMDAERIARSLDENRLQVSVFNAPPGDLAAGERGLAAVQGREADFRESITLALRYAKILRAPRLHEFDIYHCARIHGDVPAWLRRLAPLIGHVQIAGPPRRHEPQAPELPLGEIFAALKDIGYAGFIGCEYRPRAGTLAGLDWLEPYLG